MSIYDRFGVRTIINAKGPATRLSGGILAAEVTAAMTEAATYCVDMAELQAGASKVISEITGAEAGIVTSGAAAGLLPCPSALVVLLAAISQHELALGLLLIVAFSLGLAGTLTALGLAVVHARRFVPPRLATGRVAAVMPAASAALVMTLGLVLAARAVPGIT